jgi:hypothetical protein
MLIKSSLSMKTVTRRTVEYSFAIEIKPKHRRCAYRLGAAKTCSLSRQAGGQTLASTTTSTPKSQKMASPPNIIKSSRMRPPSASSFTETVRRCCVNPQRVCVNHNTVPPQRIRSQRLVVGCVSARDNQYQNKTFTKHWSVCAAISKHNVSQSTSLRSYFPKKQQAHSIA